jgi:transcriptional regulator with XRE-family HTH domain
MANRARGIGKSIHSEGHTALCELLTTARLKAGLTQQELARELRKHQSFVAKYEGGERRIDVLEFLEITRAIGSDPIRTLRQLQKRLP